MRWPELSSLGIVADVVEVWRRDAYGFAVRPQHLQRFREYAKIYKVILSDRKCSLPFSVYLLMKTSLFLWVGR